MAFLLRHDPGVRHLAEEAMDATGGTSQERRRDLLLREVVDRCQPDLEQLGFCLDDRGSTEDCGWVRFNRCTRDVHSRQGTLVLLVAHARRDCVWLVDTRFIDTALEIQTPGRKRVHRYDPGATTPQLTREVVDVVYNTLAAVPA
jgi:hypothetical protein